MEQHFEQSYLHGEHVRHILQERKAYLESLINQLDKELVNAPEGTLAIASRRAAAEYYLVSGHNQRKYLKEKDLVELLAQKSYNKKLLHIAIKEIAAVDTALQQYPAIIPEKLYEELNKNRQELVTPIYLPDCEYARQWEEQPFRTKGVSPQESELYTDKGERVRSKSEVLIANQFYRRHIPYRYEYPLKITGLGVIYPDFMVLNVRTRKEYYHEHLGMMDDPEYANRAIDRINQYAKNGIFPGDNLILTSETKAHPLNLKALDMMINRYYL